MLGGIVGRRFPWKGGSWFVEVGLVGLVEVSAGLELELTGIVVATARVAKAITETILNCIIVFFAIKTVILSTRNGLSEESG